MLLLEHCLLGSAAHQDRADILHDRAATKTDIRASVAGVGFVCCSGGRAAVSVPAAVVALASAPAIQFRGWAPATRTNMTILPCNDAPAYGMTGNRFQRQNCT